MNNMNLVPEHAELLETHDRWLWVREAAEGIAREYPIYLDTDLRDRIEGYFALKQRRPELFRHGALPIKDDRYSMLTFEEESGKSVGLVYENPKFHYILMDVMDTPKPFAYLRVIPWAEAGGTVVLPRWHGEDGTAYYGLIRLFRHAFRDYALELPRGHLEPGLRPEENAVKELREELGADPRQIEATELLGTFCADSGLTAATVYAYLVELGGDRPKAQVGHEGITEGVWLTKNELLDAIREGTVTDGMTHTTVLLHLLKSGEL